MHAKFSYAPPGQPKTAAKRLKRGEFRGCFELRAKRTDASAKVLTFGPRPQSCSYQAATRGQSWMGREKVADSYPLTLPLAKERRSNPDEIGSLLYRHAEVC